MKWSTAKIEGATFALVPLPDLRVMSDALSVLMTAMGEKRRRASRGLDPDGFPVKLVKWMARPR